MRIAFIEMQAYADVALLEAGHQKFDGFADDRVQRRWFRGREHLGVQEKVVEHPVKSADFAVAAIGQGESAVFGILAGSGSRRVRQQERAQRVEIEAQRGQRRADLMGQHAGQHAALREEAGAGPGGLFDLAPRTQPAGGRQAEW